MNRIFSVLALLSFLFLPSLTVAGCDSGGSSDSGEPDTTLDGWKMVWNDEFEAEGLPDPTKWRYETGGSGWGNHEAQTYTEKDPRNARIEDGHLIIEARQEDHAYTSARLNSTESWTYGRFEIKAQLPSGRGTWPAIWMLASQSAYGDQFWPDNGEIDIMEHVGYDPDIVHASIHTEAFNHKENTQRTSTTRIPEARAGFNVYALEWMPTRILAFVNDELYFTFRKDESYGWQEWPFDRDFHLLLNVAVGGDWGGAEGIDDSIFPQQMVIDYVRVYKSDVK